MNRSEKVKKSLLIAAGFAMATYLIMSALAILDKESAKQVNTGSEVHRNAVE